MRIVIMIENTKLCKNCNQVKSISDFTSKANKIRKKCRLCIAEQRRLYRRKNVERCRKVEYDYKHRYPEKTILKEIRSKCKRFGIPFDLELCDIIIPKFCPILDIELHKASGRSFECSPSVDRIDPNKGYTKGNIMIISHRANTIKSNGTAEEHEKVAKYIRDNTKS